MDNTPDFDAMYRASQKNSFSKPGEEPRSTVDGADHAYLKKGTYPRPERETAEPEVMDATGRRIKQKSSLSPELLGIISAVLGVVAFILIFVSMFFHFFMWLNILICLTGIGFGIAALLKHTAARVLGIIGIILCIFDLLVQLICMIVVAVSSGISAIFHAFT